MFKIYNQTTLKCLYDDTLFSAEDALSREPKITFEANKAGSLTFVARPGTSISRNDIVYVTKNTPDNIIWAGRVLSDERNEYNEKNIVCEGILALLNDTLQYPSKTPFRLDGETYKTVMNSFEHLLEHHNSLVFDHGSYQFELSDISKTAPYSKLYFPGRTIKEKAEATLINARYALNFTITRDSTFDNIKREFLDVLGGQIRVRSVAVTSTSLGTADNGDPIYWFHNYIDYIDSYNEEDRDVSNQTIEFGKNLVSITRRASIEDFATVYIPQGRSLTDVEKSWPLIQHKNATKYTVIESDPDNSTEGSYKVGRYIHSETGSIAVTSDTSFVVCQDIPVQAGEKFFLTSYLEGPQEKESESKSFVGALAYAVVTLTNDNPPVEKTLLSSGGQAKNSTETDSNTVKLAKIELNDQSIDIPQPENKTDLIVLRIGYKINSSSPHGFVLKKLNPSYAESYLTIMSYPRTIEGADGVSKDNYYPKGLDVYPISTSTPDRVESFDFAKKIVNNRLVSEFGFVYKVYNHSLKAETADEVKELFDAAKRDLLKMEEKVSLEIGAVDLSYVDNTLSSFGLLDLVYCLSKPHALDEKLPIVKIELPLDAPEKAMYMLSDKASVDSKSPSYISRYMAETYQKV